MEAIELIELIGRGEDSHTQFKQSQDVTNATSLAGELVAFANSKGGRILIGVSDQGTVTGVSAADVRRLNELLSNTATNNVRPSINPQTENVSTSDGLVMVVTVREGISKPYSDNNGVFWVKCGSDKRRVTSREEIQRMLQSADLVHADEVPVEGTTGADVDLTHFREFFEKQSGEPLEEEDAPVKLENLRLAKNRVLTLAGLLLFGRNPQRHRPELIVKAVSFVGTDPAGDRYRDSQDIGGCIRDIHARTMSFLQRNLRRIQAGQGFNTEGELEVPASALEELVVNMLLHRDYFISAPWRVMLFDDRIELISPGSLPNNLTIENIRNGISNMRNPLIASFATKELPYRGLGTGIRRALAAVPSIGLVSSQELNLFTATIPRRSEPRMVTA
jgi:predicted HTH transcriptional regulator